MEGVEAEVAEPPQGPEVDDPRSNLVYAEGLLDPDYTVGSIPLGDQASTSAIILISEIDRQLLVAVPLAVWHKKPVRRLFAARGLSKVLQCSVVSSQGADRDVASSDRQVKVWIGLLLTDLEPTIEFVSDQDPDHPFLCDDGEPGLPFAQGLVDVAAERFTFQSALSHQEEDVARPEAGRLKLLEEQMMQLQSSIQLLTKKLDPPPNLKPTAKATPKGVVPGEGGAAATGLLAGLDPQVVDAARQARVPEAHLIEMAQIVAKGPTRMEDVPRRNVRGGGALSESELEEEEVDAALEGGANPGSDGGVAKAIVKLTKVCSHLAANRKSVSKDPIEQILEGGSSGSADVTGLGNSRKNAAALRALKKCLADRPSYIYETIESHLEEDFAARAGRPGMPLGGGTIRGWLESRSRIQSYVGHIRWSWAVGGIWQALIENKYQEARARAALLVAASDQSAVDGGSWLVSQVAMLEPPAPFHAFANHQPPSHQDLQHSALLDSRWMELFISHIREMDNYQESKKKLGRPNTSLPNREEKPDPRPKVTAKAKSKGGGKGAGVEETAET